MSVRCEDSVRQGRAEDVRRRLEPDSLLAELMLGREGEGRTPTAKPSFASAGPRLIPGRPPGRLPRMAGAFSQEIRRLRAEGYSFEAIREALAKAGVAVSNSTVQREARRTSARRSGSESDTPR